MKTKLGMIGAALIALASMIHAQEFVAPSAPDRPITTTPVAPRPSIEGVVAEAFRMKQPLQLINPLAPARYGNGENVVSRSEEDPAKPKGIILFALDW